MDERFCVQRVCLQISFAAIPPTKLCVCEIAYRTNLGCSEERWQSEAIQVGGLKSARGVLGHWFDKYVHKSRSYFISTVLPPLLTHLLNYENRDWDPHGPAGPTAFWKISDEIADKSASKPQDPQMVEADEGFDEIDEEDEEEEEEAHEEEDEDDQVGEDEEELDLMVHFPTGQISFVHAGVEIEQGDHEGIGAGGDGNGGNGGFVDSDGNMNLGQGGEYSVFVSFGHGGAVEDDDAGERRVN